MKLLRNPSKKKRAKSHHAVFILDIHQISPWPALHGPLILEWQRGSKRRGQSNACDPDSDDASEPVSYHFGTTRFEIPATLYEIAERRDEMESKIVNLYLCQVNEKGKVGNMVGGVTLDLAKLTMLTAAPARQEYFIECSQSVVEMAGGRPKLIMDLSKLNEHEGVESPVKADKPKTEESALPSRLSTEMPSSQGSLSKLESTGTVMSPGRARTKEVTGTQVSGTQVYDEDGFLVDDDDDGDDALVESEVKETTRYYKAGPFEGDSLDDFDDEDQVNVEPDLTPFQASRQMPIHTRRFSRYINSSFGSLRQFQGDDMLPSPRPASSPPKPSVASCNSAMQGHGYLKGGSHPHSRRDIQIVTALEMSVWCAGLGWGGTCHGSIPRRDEMQAPARRIARTIIGLGEVEGLGFVKQAVKSIKNSCVASLGDVQKMILWWSTMVTLRWSFWTLVDDSRPEHMRMAGFEWLQTDVSDVILSCEDWLFTKIASNLWVCHVQTNVDQIHNEPDVEQFITKYIAVLSKAMDTFEDSSRPAPCSKTLKNVLKKLILRDMSVKVDVALFKDFLGQRLSIFRPLTSAQGLELKILAERLSAWFESHGLASQGEDAEKVWCLPRIVSSANVIVTPKSALLDADVRKELAPKISVASICEMLGHYTQLEEDSREQNVDEIVTTLRAKTAAKIDLNESLESLDATTYKAPEESWLTQQGIIQPLSLDMSEESDSEIEDVVGRDRAAALKELWTSHT